MTMTHEPASTDETTSSPRPVARRTLLPMLPMQGHTFGKRSAVTCHLKCADACFHPVPNTSDNAYFRDIVSASMSRRTVLAGAGAAAAAIAIGGDRSPVTPHPPTAITGGDGGKLAFNPIAPVPAAVDDVTVPDGYKWAVDHPLGRSALLGGRRVRPADAQTAEKQARQFGYNNDYLDIIAEPNGKRGVLVANFEYTNESIMFPPDLDAAERSRIAMAAHGFGRRRTDALEEGSALELRRGRAPQPAHHPETPFTFTGPAAGSDLLKTSRTRSGTTVRGTVNNCAGGTTPWGTMLSGEENFNGYFRNPGETPAEQRYGLNANGDGRGWRNVDPRFDGVANPGYRNEPNRFGWIVEIDPRTRRRRRSSTPRSAASSTRARTSASRRAGTRSPTRATTSDSTISTSSYRRTVSTARAARPLARTTRRCSPRALCTSRSSRATRPSARSTEREPCPRTASSTARAVGWRSWSTASARSPGFTTAEVLVNTRLAADAVGATKLDRPEDVEPNPPHRARLRRVHEQHRPRRPGSQGGCDRGQPAQPQPRRPRHRDHRERQRLGGDDLRLEHPASSPATPPPIRRPTSPASRPTRSRRSRAPTTSRSTPRATSGSRRTAQPGTIGLCDGLFKVPLEGAERGRVQQFLSVPREGETCGPVIHDQDGSVFVAVQHPGEDGSWASQRSYFPDYVTPGALTDGNWGGPRPSVVQVWKK